MNNKIKQELAKIEIPKELNERSKQGIKKASSERKRNVNSKKVIKAIIGLVAVAILSVGLIASNSPALASSLSQIPIIGSVFGDSDLIGLQQAQKNGLTNKIGETQTVNGISVTLDEILYDQNNITIGLFIESEKDLGEFYFDAGMDFTIDGDLPSGSTGSYGEDILSATTRTAIQEINVTEEIPDKFELGLILHGENGETWYFSTPVQKITDVKEIPVNHSQTVDGVELTVTEISVSQTGVSLSYESSEDETDFELSRGGNIEFLMVDQDGNEITGHSGGASGELVKNKIVFKSNKHFDPIDGNVTELTITPHLVIPSGGGGVEFDENGEEKELEFKGDSIQPVEFDSFKVKIPQ